jgi:hypothetical protein
MGSAYRLPTPSAITGANMQNENTFRKTRPDDVLGNLPPEKKNLIVRWLGEMSYEDP